MKMKKIILILFIGILSILIIPFNNVEAKTISSLNITNNNGKLNVSGKTENGVLAVAVLVYSGEDLIHMETCSSIDNKYSCQLNKIFEPGEYTVKVADYDGGKYISKNINIKVNNPQTFDSGISTYVGILMLSVAGITISTFKIKRQNSYNGM